MMTAVTPYGETYVLKYFSSELIYYFSSQLDNNRVFFLTETLTKTIFCACDG
jgi:hypothetical protein